MGYLYHFASSDMRGTILYPLNQLRDIYPDIYEREAAKYKGRERVMGARIPTLDCLWNDVLFMTAVHPYLLRRLVDKVSLSRPYPFRMWRFDLWSFKPDKLAVRIHRWGKQPEHRFFDPDKFDEYKVFEADSEAYYTDAMARGVRIMLPGHIPHIFYKGVLDTREATIVEA